jgi:hypothetical protein
MLTIGAIKIYSATMKWQAITVLITMMLGSILPATLSQVVVRDGLSTIGTLDVCHATTPGLSASVSEMPCVSAFPGSQKPAPMVVYLNHPDLLLPQFLIPQLNDRPPKG